MAGGLRLYVHCRDIVVCVREGGGKSRRAAMPIYDFSIFTVNK
jgi:hypothetical protein